MATGDITAIVIDPTGWSAHVTITGFTTGETFAFGDPVLSTAKFVLTVTTTGYDTSGTAINPVQTIYGTHVVRLPYPNQTTNDEVGSSPVVVRIALSEWIASGDTVVANVAAGCFINTGGAAQTSTTLTSFTCTNSSSYAHPQAFGQWSSTPYDLWQANPTLSVSARHRLNVACVKIIVTDGSNTVTTTATKQTNQRALTNGSQLYAEEWTATCNLSTINQNSAVTARFQIFPAIGQLFDSNLTSPVTASSSNGSPNFTITSGNPLVMGQQVQLSPAPTGFSGATNYFVLQDALTPTQFRLSTTATGAAITATSTTTGIACTIQNTLCTGTANQAYWCDKSVSLNVYAVVSTTGNDATGVSSGTLATAAATPYATISKALTVGTANIIYCRSASGGTYVFSGATVRPSNLNYWRRILPYPGDGTITLTLTGTVQPNVQALSVENCTMKMLAAFNWIDGQLTDTYRWVNCLYNVNGQTSTTVPSAGGYRVINNYFVQCTFDNVTAWGLNAFFVAQLCMWFDGCVLPAPSTSGITAGRRFIANKMNFVRLEDPTQSASTLQKGDPFFVEFNQMFNCSDGQPAVSMSEGTTSVRNQFGTSIIGNIMERQTGTSSPLLQLWADSDCAGAYHVLTWHNTVAGQRCNHCYDEVNSTVTFAASANITLATAANLFPGCQVVFTSTGTLDTALVAGTTYYVSVTGLTTTNMQVSATLGGASITANNNGTGTQSMCVLNNFTGFSEKFNSYYTRAIKTDTFTGTGYTPDGHKIGNWPYIYSVGSVNNQIQTNNLSFGSEWPGINTAYMPPTPTGLTPVSIANYTNDASVNGTGTGSGNYLPTVGSTLLNGVAAGSAVVGWDLTGRAIPNNGKGTVGALQFPQAASSTTGYKSRHVLFWHRRRGRHAAVG